jgi:hypothetical protein
MEEVGYSSFPQPQTEKTKNTKLAHVKNLQLPINTHAAKTTKHPTKCH